MQEKYYIQDSRGYTGNDVQWWGPGRAGYTCKIEKAGVYTKEEAFAQFERRETDIPWPKPYIDGIAELVVDTQRMKREQCGEELPVVERWIPPTPPRDHCSGCGQFRKTEHNPYEPCQKCKDQGKGSYP